MDEITSFGGHHPDVLHRDHPASAVEPHREAAMPLSGKPTASPVPRDLIAVGLPHDASSRLSFAGGDPLGEGHDAPESQRPYALSDPLAPGLTTDADGQWPTAWGEPSRDGGHSIHVAQRQCAAVPDLPDEIAALCRQAGDEHRRGMFMQKQRIAMRHRTLAFLRVHYLGWRLDLPEDERDRLTKEASRLAREARAGRGDPDIAALVRAADDATEVCEDYETRAAKRLEKIAKNLPGALFVARVAGFGFLSFGRIVGESGPLSNYPRHGHLWKRLGLAVVNGERQRKIADLELALLHGYNAPRRSVSWVAFDSCLKHQIRGGEAVGPYGEAYLRKKAEYAARGEAGEWPAKALKLRIDRMARRYAEKDLIRDLWKAWRCELRSMT